jgi:hypothetical protein
MAVGFVATSLRCKLHGPWSSLALTKAAATTTDPRTTSDRPAMTGAPDGIVTESWIAVIANERLIAVTVTAGVTGTGIVAITGVITIVAGAIMTGTTVIVRDIEMSWIVHVCTTTRTRLAVGFMTRRRRQLLTVIHRTTVVGESITLPPPRRRLVGIASRILSLTRIVPPPQRRIMMIDGRHPLLFLTPVMTVRAV